jgi:gamma-glutamyltranspeptidase / glutathione hydrolase / leukotriene-C4 hydrolase
MTLEDLADYKVKVEPALEGTYRGKKVYTTHAPTSGPVLLYMLNLLEQFEDFVKEGHTSLNAHRIIEIMKCTPYVLSYAIS